MKNILQIPILQRWVAQGTKEISSMTGNRYAMVNANKQRNEKWTNKRKNWDEITVFCSTCAIVWACWRKTKIQNGNVYLFALRHLRTHRIRFVLLPVYEYWDHIESRIDEQLLTCITNVFRIHTMATYRPGPMYSRRSHFYSIMIMITFILPWMGFTIVLNGYVEEWAIDCCIYYAKFIWSKNGFSELVNRLCFGEIIN